MDDLFKRNLLRLREPTPARTFSEALMGDASWASRRPDARAEKITPPREEFSEQKQVIESLERFAQEKTAGAPEPIIKLEGGGEILLKKAAGWIVPLSENADALREKSSLPPELASLVLKNKKKGEVQVLFVTETFRSWQEVEGDLKGGFIDELLAGLPLKTAELFERMIGAMKLAPSEVVVYPVDHDGKDLSEEVMAVAGTLFPSVIVTLGAQACQKILKGNDRLSLIHGQFFLRHIHEAGDFQVVPLFHPSIIETNQNMKKTAWSDMQKIMKHLKKLP